VAAPAAVVGAAGASVARRHGRLLLAALLGLVLSLVGLLMLPLLTLNALNPLSNLARYPTGSGIQQVYWQMYTVVAARFGVNPYLLASIHKQESDFSTNPSVRSGVNGYGCCAGPMQFNVVAGYWGPHKYAFRTVEDSRPASYPLDRRELGSCRGVPEDTGCVYDDFDAIAGAAHKLRADGADTSLTSAGTRRAVCAYIGACFEVDDCTGSPNEYCEVLPRARAWQLRGSGGAPATGARGIVEHAAAIAQRFGRAVYVCSDHRPGAVTESGRPSDHAFNSARRAARDIALRGRDCIEGPPSLALDRAAVAIGAYFGVRYRLGAPILADTFHWRGYRIQIIWRTTGWGGHLGHIHIGARRV
jgi:hypothetical protein